MKYYSKVDGLRFIAIFFVLIEHFAIVIGRHISAGYYGVDLFFVISGFLITSILVKPNEKSFAVNYKNFIGRRTLRIFPVYYLTILILWIIGLPAVRENLIYLVTYSFNYASVRYNISADPVTHFWSLCVEEQFYLFWPFVVLTLKNKPRYLMMVIFLMIMIGYTQTLFNIFPAITIYNYWGLLTRMASLGAGALGAVLLSENLVPDKIFKSRSFEYFMLLLLAATLVLQYSFGAPILGLCSLYLVLKAANFEFYFKPLDRFLENKKIVYIGTLAYGIYIFHLPIRYYFTLYVFNPVWNNINFDMLGKLKILQTNSWIIKFPILSLLSFLLAAASYKFIEGPVLKLKNRFFR
ncbi:MAG: acyltransferase [Ferruginibacter sp.]